MPNPKNCPKLKLIWVRIGRQVVRTSITTSQIVTSTSKQRLARSEVHDIICNKARSHMTIHELTSWQLDIISSEKSHK